MPQNTIFNRQYIIINDENDSNNNVIIIIINVKYIFAYIYGYFNVTTAPVWHLKLKINQFRLKTVTYTYIYINHF